MSLKSKIISRLDTKEESQLDVVFYRDSYADLKGMTDKQLNQHWRLSGKKEKRFPNLSAMLEASGVTDIKNFDFDLDLTFYLAYYPDLAEAGITSLTDAKIHWLTYGKKENRYATANQWIKDNAPVVYTDINNINIEHVLSLNKDIRLNVSDVLNVAIGVVNYPIKFFSGDNDNAIFYKKLGVACYLKCKSSDCLDALNSARNLWRISLFFNETAGVLEHIGNSYLDKNNYRKAQKAYEEAIELSVSPTEYAVKNLLVCFEKQYLLSKGLDFLVQCIKKSPDLTFLTDLLNDYTDKMYVHYLDGLGSIARLDKREALKVRALEFSKTIYNAYYSTFSQKNNRSDKTINTQKVLIVGDFHIPQCIRYRIEQKVEQLELQGKQVTTVDWTQLQEQQNEIALHDIVIFYRVPSIPIVLKAMAQVNANDKISFYEIDDLLFEESYPAPLATFGGYIGLSSHIELRESMASFYSAAQFCRYGISSTQLLCKKLEQLVIDKKCILHRNGLDKENVISKLDKSNKNTIDIFYGSGTQAHNSDFITQALPALERILSTHKNVRLVIAGYLQLPRQFTNQYASQLQQLPPVKNIKAYWTFLEQADINLAVLNDDEINGCKSELKWLEAACFSIPTVVSTTNNYRDVLTSGSDAFIASNEKEWYDALNILITQPEKRHEIANSALTKVQNEYSVDYLGEKLVKSFDELLIGKKINPPKKKIALVNVFFPPQSIGGATRVLSDNFDVLRKQYGDDIELVVFTSDIRCTTPYELMAYQYEGITVYRTTILYRENMDWHPQDKKMYDMFEQFLELEKPDMVHFHCVQRLTASVVEATMDNNIPYMITAHDAWWISDHQFLVDKNDKVYPDGHPDMFAPRTLPDNVTLGESIERILYFKELLNGAEHILTVSEGFAEIYRKNGYPQIQVNKNGISSTVEWLPKDTKKSDKVVCAHIGGMASHKGYFLLKEALKNEQPKNIEMLIVDHSKDDGYIHKTSWGIVPVTFIGRVKQNEIVPLYQKIDVLFAPSLWPESYGLVTREAAACGCWVVASDLGGIGEDIIEGQTGLRVKPELTSISKVIKEIDSNTNKFKQAIKQTDIRIVDKQVEELTEIYK